jgi:hypothetical protein
MSRILLFFIAIAFLTTSCEEVFIPDIEEEQRIIVEGHIESGPEALPPYVILSKSLPFFGTIRPEDISNNQIIDATVEVWHNDISYELSPFCLSDLPPNIREMILNDSDLSFVPDSADFCLYLDWQSNIPVAIGETYDLHIELSDGQILTASTSIPPLVPIDSFEFTEPPGNPEADTLARLLCYLSDPAGESNFYRYLTASNDQGFIAGFGSVVDDAFFDGKAFQFPLQKAEDPQANEEFDEETFGLYKRGERVRIKWMNIDEAHYNFWNSFEFNLNNQGPFATYTRVSSNVTGALGIWGGYSSVIYTLEVPER